MYTYRGIHIIHTEYRYLVCCSIYCSVYTSTSSTGGGHDAMQEHKRRAKKKTCATILHYNGTPVDSNKVVKTGTLDQTELFDPQLMQLIFDPVVKNGISYRNIRES